MIDDFGKFWNVYPRRVSVASARQAWAVAITKTTAQVLIEAATRLAQDPNREPQFTPSPANWLSGERWLDDPLPPRKLTPDEAKKQDIEIARKKDEAERRRALELTREAEEAKANAVPMPPELKKRLLAQWADSTYPRP